MACYAAFPLTLKKPNTLILNSIPLVTLTQNIFRNLLISVPKYMRVHRSKM